MCAVPNGSLHRSRRNRVKNRRTFGKGIEPPNPSVSPGPGKDEDGVSRRRGGSERQR